MSQANTANAKLAARLQAGERLTRGGKPLSAAFLQTQVDLARRYSLVEKLVLGDTQVSYSPSSLNVGLDLKGDVVAQGERLAAAERRRHKLPAGPVLEIDALIEDQGIKVIASRFPQDATSLGAFFFDGEIGPTILVNSSAAAADVSYALARHYGHFLADYEPYPYIVCGRPDPQSFTDASEVRAHLFALAFLMPEEDIDMYRKAVKLERHEVLQTRSLQQLQVYFEVDAELILWRLLSLEWITPPQLQQFLEEQPEIAQSLQQAPVFHPGTDVLPDRFVQLVARGFGDDRLDLRGAAELLGVEKLEAERLLSQFRYDSSESAPRRSSGSPSVQSFSEGESLH